MADKDSKRYYYLKFKKDFFQQHQIKVLKAMPNGRLYALIYVELLAESTSHQGELRYSQMIPYDIVTLAAVIDEDKDNVEKAIQTLSMLELVEVLDDQTIYMREVAKMIGSESGQTIRKREALVNSTEHLPNIYQKNTQENRDKSIDIKDYKKHIYGTYSNVKLTLNERTKLEEEYGNSLAEELISYLDEYIEMTGKKYKSHYLVIKKWVVDAVSERRSKTSKVEMDKCKKIDIVPDYSSSNKEVDLSILDNFRKDTNG